jgi:hypothetical protein
MMNDKLKEFRQKIEKKSQYDIDLAKKIIRNIKDLEKVSQIKYRLIENNKKIFGSKYNYIYGYLNVNVSPSVETSYEIIEMFASKGDILCKNFVEYFKSKEENEELFFLTKKENKNLALKLFTRTMKEKEYNSLLNKFKE